MDARNHAYSLHLSLFPDNGEHLELWLPKTPEGIFHFSDIPEYRFLSICAKDGQWKAVCKKPAFFQNVPISDSCEIALCDGQLLSIDAEDQMHHLFVELAARESMVFKNYFVHADVEINIGSHPSNDIICDSPYFSRKHATLTRRSGCWSVYDHGSESGVYVNHRKTARCNLCLGDVIQIMGLRIIIGPNYLSINDHLCTVKLDASLRHSMAIGYSGYSHYSGQLAPEPQNQHYNRSPRKRLQVEQKTITIEGPPMSMSGNQMPLMLRMGSSMVMGGAAALAGNFMTLLSSVLFPFLSSKYTDKQREDYERLRLQKYTEYLSQKYKEIADACQDEQLFLNQKYPPLNEVAAQAVKKEHLWERRPGDDDFLHVRLGSGIRPLSALIEYPQRRFSLDRDELEEKMYALAEEKYLVHNAPIVLSLEESAVCGLLGRWDHVLDCIQNMVLQLAFYHSYDEVKTVFLLTQEQLAQFDEIRYLPHAWDDNRSIRFVATSEAEAYTIGEYIKDQTEGYTDQDLKKILKSRPYYLIFALDKKLFDGHEIFKELIQADHSCGVSFVTAFDDLLKETHKIIHLETDKHNTCTSLAADSGDAAAFSLDPRDSDLMCEAIRTLSNTSLKTVTQAQAIPKMVTFLEMYNTGRIEQLNPLKRWQENNPVKSLAAPIGVGPDGSLFMLDLHEKRQGPHGLVAGMTGSGKSEFIITYILSMAVNYHPDEVAFVLIDYKGGGLAGAFENPQTGVRLPHLVGTITNLDGSSIQRSLMSIESELIRRQKLFNEVKSTVNEGTMDIYTYQKLYRAGKVSKPVPHLFIISDEFAELKQQQPEFMDKLISAARIGRSLGVHLILATQKPSGVVNDQIRSNTKFRVCLRVQERSDSMDMLKRPEAAELTDTGRFYLQVGYNEYFAMGQSAWCGAAYEPQDTVLVQRDDTIEFLDTTGQVITKAKPKVKKTDSGKKQIVAIVEYLSELAKNQGIHPQQLWAEELPEKLDLDFLQFRNSSPDADHMSVCLGMVDDPTNQRQFPFVINFATSENLLIAGESGSGKSTIIQNILYSLSKQLAPQEFHFYALDYSSRMLKLFKPLPHCGSILQEEDVGSLDEFFKLINSLVAERKKLFSTLEVDNFDSARKLCELPLILVVIDNIAGLSVSKQGESHTYKLQNYLKDSANYGVKYIVTCSHMNEVPSRIKQQLGDRICLHMRDKYDYGEILGCKVGYTPPDVPGRGLIKHDEYPLEFQSAMLQAEADEQARSQYIKSAAADLIKQYGQLSEALRLPVIKEDAEYEEFAAQFKRGRIPLGYSKSTHKPVALPLKQFSTLSIYFGNTDGTIPILNNILYAAEREKMEVWIIKRCGDSLFDQQIKNGVRIDQLSNVDYLTCSVDNLRLLQRALVNLIDQRKEVFVHYCKTHNISPTKELRKELFSSVLYNQAPPFLLLIESVASFCGALNALSMMSYCDLFENLSSYNIFTIGCFEPEIPQAVSNNSLFGAFSKNDVLLFGGNFDKQTLFSISNTPLTGRIPFNSALMIYRRETHAIIMPCGKTTEKAIDEDLQSIF